jgi:glycerate-2-kinase
LHIVDNQLQISLDNSSDKRRDGGWKKIHLIAFGKAACTVAKAAQEVIPAHLFNGTWIHIWQWMARTHDINIFNSSYIFIIADGYARYR